MTSIDEVLSQLTTDEKISQLAGEDMWHVPAIERLGIGRLKMSDGPIGARGETFGGGPASTCFPCGIALGATWDTDLVHAVGAALGDEAKAKSAHVLLGPTINIQRYPLGGRHFECYSEDPHLTAVLASAYVRGLQSSGVAACVKHLVCNDVEVDRFTIDVVVDERTMREVYLLPFEAALIDAGAWSTMGAYSKLNGPYCCEAPWLLTELLRDDWGWDGAVVSDWLATHSTMPALTAGLDVEMPGPPNHRGTKLADAIASGEIKAGALDAAARRVLLLRERTGALTNAGASPDERYDDNADRRALVRRAAAEAIVLLQNDDGVLPIDPTKVKRVAVIGPNADVVFQPMGGGSAEVTPPYVVTPLDGIANALESQGVRVTHDVGTLPTARYVPLDPRSLSGGGYHVALTGGSVAEMTTTRSAFRWGTDVTAARITATYVAGLDGVHEFELRGQGRMRLSVDGTVVADGWERGERPPAGTVSMQAGQEHALLIEFEAPPDPTWMTGFQIGVHPPWPDEPRHPAAEAALAADAAIVVVGLTREDDTEGRDRRHLSLPEGQDELVAAVAAANPRTVVVLNCGSPVTMPWRDDVAAIVQLWYPGQEGGNALADVLTGAVDAAGRLPCTFPVRLEDSPAHVGYPGTNGQLAYEEGVFVGYRGYEAANTAPLFAFGHGLSYATFEYGTLTADRSGASIEVTNTSTRDGVEVVQLYVGDVEASVPRPAQELKGVAKLRLGAEETATARFEFDDRTFAFWDIGRAGGAPGAWRVEPGEFTIAVGASSADIRATTTITV